ncbi:MAG: hypothetical protein LBD37_06975 [Treponema sp.]|nr:hypothetical protein [Treponema sp.]
MQCIRPALHVRSVEISLAKPLRACLSCAGCPAGLSRSSWESRAFFKRRMRDPLGLSF